eukprot:gene17293-8870_t
MAINRKMRIVILGDKGVGKTALMVRCLTRRFLPEYATGCDECHTFQTMIDGENVRMEIIDSSKNSDFAITLADGFIVVYSVTSAESLRTARRLVRDIREKGVKGAPIVLLGNKKDLEHHREVSRSKATEAARKLHCNLFCELSVATDISAVRNVFSELYKRIQRKTRAKSVVERAPKKGSALYLMIKALNNLKSNIVSSKCPRSSLDKALRIETVKDIARMPVL